MKRILAFSALAALVAGGAWAADDALKSGPQCGGAVGAFNVIKIAGPDDGVRIGQELCYR